MKCSYRKPLRLLPTYDVQPELLGWWDSNAHMKETRLKGLYQGGTLPYGYKLDGRKVVIDEQQAKHVLFMYEQYSKGVFV